MGDVVILNVETNLELSVERVLDGASEAQLAEVLLLGWTDDGDFYAACTHSDLGKHLILLEKAKTLLIAQLEEL